MTKQHPTLDQLNEYILDPAQEDFVQLRRHLMFCGHCRIRIGKLEQLVGQLATTSPAILPKTKDDIRAKSHTTIVSALVDYLTPIFSTRMPVWSTALTLALLVSLSFIIPKQDIISYQDSALMSFTSQTTPGISFFTQAKQYETPFSGLQIKRRQQGIELNWPMVKGASFYQLEIYITSNGLTEAVFSGKSQTNRLNIENFTIISQRQYTWRLSGQTSNNYSFQSTGGFVAHE